MDNIPEYDINQLEKDSNKSQENIVKAVENVKIESFCDMIDCDQTIQELLNNKNVKKSISQLTIISIVIVSFIILSLLYLMKKKCKCKCKK